MPKKRSRAKFSWKQEYGGVPAWGIAAAIGLLAVIVATPAMVNATTPTAAPYVRPSDAFAEPTPEPTVEPMRVAFLGDSFSPAQDTAVADYNYAAVLAKGQGWEVLPFGRGGTGYTNPGQAEEGDDVYVTRVPAVIAAAPSMVIVQGSTNDNDYDLTRAAAADVFAQLAAGLPGVPVVAVGPLATPLLGENVTARDAVRDAAAEAGVTFIDPIAEGWLAGNPDWFEDDGVHPSGTGQAEIARRLQEALPTR